MAPPFPAIGPLRPWNGPLLPPLGALPLQSGTAPPGNRHDRHPAPSDRPEQARPIPSPSGAKANAQGPLGPFGLGCPPQVSQKGPQPGLSISMEEDHGPGWPGQQPTRPRQPCGPGDIRHTGPAWPGEHHPEGGPRSHNGAHHGQAWP